MEVTRRTFVKATGLTAGTIALIGPGALLAGCAQSGSKEGAQESSSEGASEAPQKVVLGYYSGVCEAPIYIGIEKGFFEEAGLDPETLVITNQKPAALIANDQLDSYELTPDTFMAMKEGAEYCIIDSLHVGCVKGVARPEMNIKSWRDLEGKTLGGKPSSIAAIQIASLMAQAGMDPASVTWKKYDSKPMYEKAMWDGEIDGFCAYDPWCDIAELNGAVKFFDNGADEELKDYLCCFVGMNTKTLAADPEIGRKLSQGFKKACEYLQENPEECAELIIEKGYVPVDTDSGFTAEICAKEIKEYNWIAGDEDMLKKSFEKIWMDIYYSGNLTDVPEGTKPEDYINDTLYKQMVNYCG